MANLTHDDLLELGFKLGYGLSRSGLCQGFSGMVCQAWLTNDAETFFKRLKLIEKYNNDFDKLERDINNVRYKLKSKEKTFEELNDDEKLLLEIPALYDGIELYLRPGNYPDLFAGNVPQTDIATVFSMTHSKNLAQNDLSIALDKPYVFDKKSLRMYLKDLATVLESTDSNAPIMLSASNHTVCLYYEAKNKIWQYVDTNDFELYGRHSYSRKLNTTQLADSIFHSFDCHNHVVIDMTIITTSDKKKKLETHLNEFDKKYPITAKEIKMYDDHQVGLLFLSCQNGNLNIVHSLLKYPEIDVNHINERGSTAFYIAFQNGHLDIVRELSKYNTMKIKSKSVQFFKDKPKGKSIEQKKDNLQKPRK